jgi:hypothetical protein
MINFKKKILIIGSPDSDEPDLTASTLALKSNTLNHGLLTNQNINVEEFGYYHTTVADLLPGKIVDIAKNFNSIILLDQDNYQHFKVFVTTFRLMQDLEDEGDPVIYKDTKLSKRMLFWKDYFQKNLLNTESSQKKILHNLGLHLRTKGYV